MCPPPPCYILCLCFSSCLRAFYGDMPRSQGQMFQPVSTFFGDMRQFGFFRFWREPQPIVLCQHSLHHIETRQIQYIYKF